MKAIATHTLLDYLDGALAPAERAELERLLQTQPALRARLARARELREELRATLADVEDIPLGAKPPWRKKPMATKSAVRRPRLAALASGVLALLLVVTLGVYRHEVRTLLGGDDDPATAATPTITATPTIALPARDLSAPIQTDALLYSVTLDGDMVEFTITVTYTNQTGGPLYIHNCNRPYYPSIQKLVAGRWELFHMMIEHECLGTPIRIEPNDGTYAQILNYKIYIGPGADERDPGLDPRHINGIYRLRHELPRAWRFGPDDPQVDANPLEVVSNEFVLLGPDPALLTPNASLLIQTDQPRYELTPSGDTFEFTMTLTYTNHTDTVIPLSGCPAEHDAWVEKLVDDRWVRVFWPPTPTRTCPPLDLEPHGGTSTKVLTYSLDLDTEENRVSVFRDGELSGRYRLRKIAETWELVSNEFILIGPAPLTPVPSADKPNRLTLIQTDAPAYQIVGSGDQRRLTITITYTNPTDGPLYIPFCGQPYYPNIEKRVSGGWESFAGKVERECLGPPIRIDPNGGTYTQVLVYGDVFTTLPNRGPIEGTYRLRHWLQRAEIPSPNWEESNGDPIEVLSNEFELAEPGAQAPPDQSPPLRTATLPPRDPSAPIQTDQRSYTPRRVDDMYRFTIDITYTNPLDRQMYMHSCMEPDHPVLEKLVDGAWVGVLPLPMRMCGGYDLTFEPRATYRHTFTYSFFGLTTGEGNGNFLESEVVPGTYRLRDSLSYSQIDQGMPRLLEIVSNEFVLTEADPPLPPAPTRTPRPRPTVPLQTDGNVYHFWRSPDSLRFSMNVTYTNLTDWLLYFRMGCPAAQPALEKLQGERWVEVYPALLGGKCAQEQLRLAPSASRERTLDFEIWLGNGREAQGRIFGTTDIPGIYRLRDELDQAGPGEQPAPFTVLSNEFRLEEYR